MESNQELACLEFVGIHAVEKHSFATLHPEILAIEFGRHRTPNFGALYISREKRNRENNISIGTRLSCNKSNETHLDIGDMAFSGEIPGEANKEVV